jgi:hypothetical protein
MHALPVTLRPDERRELARRLAERLGTRTAGGMGLLAREEDGRLLLEGEAGEVKVKGVQEIGARQRDVIAIGGLPDGLGIVLEVDEAAAGPPSEPPPVAVRLRFEGGPEEARARALEEAYRFAGERFAASLPKGQALLRLPPLAPLDEPEAKRRVRGRWAPLLASRLEGTPPLHLRGLALVRPQREGDSPLIVRASSDPGAPRAATPIAAFAQGLLLAHVEVDRPLDAKAVEKALAALAWDLLQETAAEPRPAPEEVALEPGPAPFATCAFALDRPLRLAGQVRAAATGHRARTAALDGRLTTPEGKPYGLFLERHLLGLPGEGFVLAATSTVAGRTSFTLGAPEAKLEKWTLRLGKALGG